MRTILIVGGSDLGFRYSGLGFRVWGLAFRVSGVVRVSWVLCSYEQETKFKLSGNEVRHTNSLILPVKNLCFKLHCHNDFDLIPFSYKCTWSTRSLVMRMSTERGSCPTAVCSGISCFRVAGSGFRFPGSKVLGFGVRFGTRVPHRRVLWHLLLPRFGYSGTDP